MGPFYCLLFELTLAAVSVGIQQKLIENMSLIFEGNTFNYIRISTVVMVLTS